MLSFFRAIVIGLFQGVTELFPVSSLGHSVLDPGAARMGRSRQGAVEGVVLPRVPRRLARRYRARVARSTTAPTGSRSSAACSAARASAASRRPTQARRAVDRRDDPRRSHRPRVRTRAAHAVRQADRRRDLPHDQRRDPAWSAKRCAGASRRGVGYRGDGSPVGRSIESLTYHRGGLHRRHADRRAVRRHQPFGHHDGRRSRCAASTTRTRRASRSCSRRRSSSRAGVYKIPDLTGHLGDGIRGQAIVGAVVAGDRGVPLDEVPRALLRDAEPARRSASTA